jgi:hypothetical protein
MYFGSLEFGRIIKRSSVVVDDLKHEVMKRTMDHPLWRRF